MKTYTLKKHYPWITLVTLTLIIGLLDTDFLRPTNLLGLAGDISTLFIMAMGMTFVIFIGGIDLSSQAIANMITVITTLSLSVFGLATVPIAILIGIGFGSLSGIFTTYFKVPSFVSTLAVGGIALSVAQFASDQRALYMDSELRNQIFGWIISDTTIIPHVLIIAVVLLFIAYFFEKKTKIGRILKAIGSAEQAANASGLAINRSKIIAFAISGAFAAIAGLIFSIQLAGGSPILAEGFLLPSIVAVLVGGTPLTGGVGGVLNTFIGAMIVAVIRTGMIYLDVPAISQQMFFGIVLIIAIALTIDRTKMKIVK